LILNPLDLTIIKKRNMDTYELKLEPPVLTPITPIIPELSSFASENGYGRVLLYVGLVLLFFALAGEWKATSSVSDESRKYGINTSIEGVDNHRQCNNYIYTENFVRKVHTLSAVQWRRAMITSFFSLTIAIPISKLKPSYRQLDILLFVVFVTSWCVNGFMDYHLRSVSDTAIEVGMQNTATTFTGDYVCTVVAEAV
jgi:hypothetical protein